MFPGSDVQRGGVKWISDPHKIAVHYLKSWFLIDFLSVGVSAIVSPTGSNRCPVSSRVLLTADSRRLGPATSRISSRSSTRPTTRATPREPRALSDAPPVSTSGRSLDHAMRLRRSLWCS